MANETNVTVRANADDRSWWQETAKETGGTGADLFAAMRRAYEAQSMAASHPDQAQALKAFDAWAAKGRDMIAGAIAQADVLVQQATDAGAAQLADAMARLDAVSAERDEALAAAKASAAEAKDARAALKVAEGERDEALGKAAQVDECARRERAAQDALTAARAELDAQRAAVDAAAQAERERDLAVQRSESLDHELARALDDLQAARADAKSARDGSQATIQTLSAQLTRAQAEADRLRGQRDDARGALQEERATNDQALEHLAAVKDEQIAELRRRVAELEADE